MDFGLSFRYVFKDEAWVKKLVSVALWGLIPVIGVLVIGGWGLKVGKMVIDGHAENKLPKVEFGADLRRGILASLIDLIYILPAMMFFATAVVLIRSGFNVEGIAQGFLFVMGGLFGLVGLLLWIMWFFIATVAFANFLAKDRFGAAFNFRELFGLLKHSFIFWVMLILCQFLAMAIIAPLGIVLFGIGIFITTAYAAVLYAHLLGQAYRLSVSNASAEKRSS
ncbi:MAG: DUF4013 domain-containing protein [Brevefilum sp.]|nr:DUF4013 domain-containing protein [Brevefilum sp.]